MANPYTKPTLTGYNASPPADDGSQVEANKVKWTTHKTKLGDPLKTFAEEINDNVSSAFDTFQTMLSATSVKSADYTVLTTDNGTLILASGASTLTLPPAVSAGDGFRIAIKKTDIPNTITLDANGSETIDGALTFVMTAQYESVIIVCDASSWHVVAHQDMRESHNLVINGAMGESFRGTSFATLTASQYTLDRMEWIDSGTTSGAVTITQDTDVPTVAEAGTKFENSMKIDVTTAEDLASGDAALYFSHKIEARNCTQFGHGATGALAGRLSFWFKSTKTGIFTVNLDRNDATEKYSTEFTVGTTDTWERHTVVIPGDTGGTAIANDNGIGLAIQIMMAVGATGRTSTADAWNASGATELATANQVNLLDNTSNNVLITGLEFKVGATDDVFRHEDVDKNLLACQRYGWGYTDIDTGDIVLLSENASTTIARAVFAHPVQMRAAAAVSISAASDLKIVDAGGVHTVTSIPLGASPDPSLSTTINITSSGLTGNGASEIQGNGTNGTLFFEAEL